MKRHRVLIVDDSALIRQILSELFRGTPDLQVVGTAGDPFKAWEKIRLLKPDVLTLDVEMPRMDGLTFLSRLMRVQPMPVVMVSKLTAARSDATLRALALGAVDFTAKPALDVRRGTLALADELIEKVRMAASARVSRRRPAALPQRAGPPGARTGRPDKTPAAVVAVGASTGGVQALEQILLALSPNSPGMVVVQHMPAGFTRSFAERLDKLCALDVKEAETGDLVLPGRVLIAPGGQQLELRAGPSAPQLQVFPGAPVNRHRPSVDVLFKSCAAVLGPATLGVLLTGMGNDGAAGMKVLHQAGAQTIAQDEDSCVVFGMPREAIALKAVDRILPLIRIPQAIQCWMPSPSDCR